MLGGPRHTDGDQDTETFKAEIIPRTWISFGRTGIRSVCQKKKQTQELSMMGYNENLQGALLCLYSLTCGKPSSQELGISRLFQSPVITEQKKPRHSRLLPIRAREGHSQGIQFQWHREGNSHPRIESSRTQWRKVRGGTF